MFCLVIASILWLAHALNRNYPYTINIPVRFVNLPTNKTIVGDLPESINVDIKTSGLKLLFIILKNSQEVLEINLESFKQNNKAQTYLINSNVLALKQHVNFDFEVLKIRPDTLNFTSIKGQSKLIPIKGNFNIDCKAGYSIVSKPIVTPAFITVLGDSSEINTIDTIYTETVKLTQVSENYSSQVALINHYKNVYYNPKNVLVTFNVDRLIEHKITVPVTIANNTSNETIKLLPQTITVSYLVSMKEYENVSENLFKATVNYAQLLNKQKLLDVELTRTPSDVKIISIEPKQISYLIFK